MKINMSFFSVLTLIFITLKLTEFIGWSWWLVLGPVWMPPLFAIVVVVPLYSVYVMLRESKEKEQAEIKKQSEDLEALAGIDTGIKH